MAESKEQIPEIDTALVWALENPEYVALVDAGCAPTLDEWLLEQARKWSGPSE